MGGLGVLVRAISTEYCGSVRWTLTTSPAVLSVLELLKNLGSSAYLLRTWLHFLLLFRQKLGRLGLGLG